MNNHGIGYVRRYVPWSLLVLGGSGLLYYSIQILTDLNRRFTNEATLLTYWGMILMLVGFVAAAGGIFVLFGEKGAWRKMLGALNLVIFGFFMVSQLQCAPFDSLQAFFLAYIDVQFLPFIIMGIFALIGGINVLKGKSLAWGLIGPVSLPLVLFMSSSISLMILAK